MRHGLLAWLVVYLALGCGPSRGDGDDDGDDGGGPDAGVDVCMSGCGNVTGTVWAPNMAPGMVPPDQEIPIHGALVRVTTARLPPVPAEVYCEPCVDGGDGTLTDHGGRFDLGPLRPGRYWLTIQKGQFRLEQQIDLPIGTLALPDAMTVLPSVSDPAGGRTIPRIAMAVGSFDKLESILGKMGLGTVDGPGEYVSTMGEIDIYQNGGNDLGMAQGTISQLVSDPARLRSYHIIFIPCSTALFTAVLDNQQNLKNLRDYVAAGGKLYVTDWSGEWMDNVFPTQVTLGDPGTDTPAAAYDATLDRWDPSLFGDADGSYYDSPDGEAADADLRTWLHGQHGPLSESGNVGAIDASNFGVFDNWNWISALTNVIVGHNAEGMEIVDEPKAWVIGSGSRDGGPSKRPLTVTFNPPGCGRVLFSTYHTTPGSHVGLLPQERVLLYLIMEIGVCNNNLPIP